MQAVFVVAAATDVIRIGVFTEIMASTSNNDAVYAHPTTACVAATSLSSAVRVLRNAYQGTAALEFTRNVITNRREMPHNLGAVLESLNLTVRHMPPPKPPTTLRLNVVRFVEYDVVFFVDLDHFLTGANIDVVGLVATGSRRVVAHRAFVTPANVGFFAFQPSRALARRMDRALSHGYDPVTYWGDAYPAWVLKLRDDRAERHHGKGPAFGDGDPGMLVHLAAQVEDSNPLGSNYFAAHHLSGPGSRPKPWYPAKVYDDCFAASAKKSPPEVRQQAAADCLGKDKLDKQTDFWAVWSYMTFFDEPAPYCQVLMGTERKMRQYVLGL